MAITQNDLLYKYTGTAGTANPQTSLGGTLNANTIPSGVANNVFDDVTGSESSLGASHYRCIGIHNTLTTHVWMNTSIRVDGYDRAGSSNDVIYFWAEKPAGAGGNPDGTVQIIGSETTAPSGVSWTAEGAPSSYTTISGKDYTGSIGADDWSAIWLFRSIPAGAAAYTNRSCTIRVQGETSASPLVIPVEAVFRVDWSDKDFKVSRILGDIKADVY